MIDLHTHILPGLDDGSRDMAGSLAMARAARDDGITTVVATPHVLPGVFDNDKDMILSAVEELNQNLRDKNVAVSVLPGAECRLEADLPPRLARGELLTINNNGRYLLVELPSAYIPEYTAQILYEIQLRGVTPIIAHPERNVGFANRPVALRELVARGVLAQITSASLTGFFGKYIKRTAWSFLQQGLAHLVSSDAHSPKGRAPLLSPARQMIERDYGPDLAWLLVLQNPSSIIAGREVQVPRVSKPGNWRRLFRR